MHFIFIIKRQQCLKGCHYIRYSFVLYHFLFGVLLIIGMDLAEKTESTTDAFYHQDRSERAKLVDKFYSTQADTPAWLKAHYEDETGYSFPSGHSIFAATWLMLAVGFSQLLGNRSFKAELLIGAMTIWGVLMLISRVRLGMHYPIDLFVAIISAWIVHLIIFGFLQKKGLFNNK